MNLELALSSSFQESLAALASVLLGPALGPAEGPGRPLDRLTKKEVWRVLSAFEDALAARGGGDLAALAREGSRAVAVAGGATVSVGSPRRGDADADAPPTTPAGSSTAHGGGTNPLHGTAPTAAERAWVGE